MAFFKSEVFIHELHPNAAALLTKGIHNLFRMTITQEALAQIIDNMPIKGHYYGPHATNRQPHPDIESRREPSKEASSLARELGLAVDPMDVKVDAERATAFQEELQASPNSHSLALRSLELLSGIVHDICSKIHGELHPPPEFYDPWYPYGHLEHRFYFYNNAYKHRMASIAGYWAETYIFGGPVLFARGASGKECKAAYLHLPTGILVSGEIKEVSESQIDSFMALVFRDDISAMGDTTLLPFNVSATAPSVAIEDAVDGNIYRDPGQISRWFDNWKRSSLQKGWRPDGTRGCVE